LLELISARAGLGTDWKYEPVVLLTDLNEGFIFFEFVRSEDALESLEDRIISRTKFNNLTDGLEYLNKYLKTSTPLIQDTLHRVLYGGHAGGSGGGGASSLGRESDSRSSTGGSRGDGSAGGGNDGNSYANFASGSTSLHGGSLQCPLHSLSQDEAAAYDAEESTGILLQISDDTVALLGNPEVACGFGMDSISSVRVSFRGETIVRRLGLV